MFLMIQLTGWSFVSTCCGTTSSVCVCVCLLRSKICLVTISVLLPKDHRLLHLEPRNREMFSFVHPFNTHLLFSVILFPHSPSLVWLIILVKAAGNFPQSILDGNYQAAIIDSDTEKLHLTSTLTCTHIRFV